MFKIVEFSHLLIKEYITSSPLNYIRCLDATCGAGNDTIFLASLLKECGHVDAYDIQDQAIKLTQEKVTDNNLTNVTLFKQSHEYINPSNYDLAIFNLGFLPNANKEITTTYQSTLKAVSLLTDEILNNQHLLIIICVYPGHEAGLLESQYLDEFVRSLRSSDYLVSKYLNYNRPTSPYILTISSNKGCLK